MRHNEEEATEDANSVSTTKLPVLVPRKTARAPAQDSGSFSREAPGVAVASEDSDDDSCSEHKEVAEEFGCSALFNNLHDCADGCRRSSGGDVWLVIAADCSFVVCSSDPADDDNDSCSEKAPDTNDMAKDV